MSNGASAKRFFKSHIFRACVMAVVMFSTLFFPLVFAFPNLDSNNRSVLVALVVFSCVFELLIYIVVIQLTVYSKLGCAVRSFDSMLHGNTRVRLKTNSIDSTASDILAAVNATSEEYARLEQVRRSFVSNASHELRTPLTSVQGFLQAVLDGTIDECDREKYLKIALSETKRLNTLINSMLDLSRLESGKNPLIKTKFNITDVMHETAAKFEPALINKALQINVDCARDNCYVYADKEKIIQVLTNLVDNAIKYSPSYSRIILTSDIHDDKVFVTVRDFGYGISKKDQMLIWDRFYMTDKSRSPVKSKGSGLGLSIVKKIIDDHDEIIWVESNRGAGATFIFSLTLFNPAKHKVNVGKVIKSDDETSETSEITTETL